MKAVSNDFKQKINEYGRKLDTTITYGQITLTKDNIYRINPNFHTNLMETLMKAMIIEVDRLIAIGTRIHVQSGVEISEGVFEYVDYGYYTVREFEKDETKDNFYTLKCYDDMVKTMIPYDIKPVFPISVKNLLTAICDRFSFTLNTQTFINDDSLIDTDEFTKASYTFRDVLDEIATVTCSTIEIENDIMYVKYPINTSTVIDEDILNDTNVILSKKYGPVNRLVITNTGVEGDKAVDDNASIDAYGVNEVELNNKQLFANTRTRDNMINEMWTFLDGFQYILCDLDTQGLMYVEALDKVDISIKGVTTNVIIFEDETQISDGLNEELYNDEPGFKKNDYSSGGQKSTYDAYTAVFRELTREGESVNGVVYLDKVNKSQPLLIRVQPIEVNITRLYPHSRLYPDYSLYMTTRKIRFTNTVTEEIFDWEMPDDLLYYNDRNYDDLTLNFDEKKVIINKKCKYNADGTVGLLQTPRTDEYEYPEDLYITDGDYQIDLLGYDKGYLYVKLISLNQYFSQFVSKIEFTQTISELEERIKNLEERVTRLEESE